MLLAKLLRAKASFLKFQPQQNILLLFMGSRGLIILFLFYNSPSITRRLINKKKDANIDKPGRNLVKQL